MKTFQGVGLVVVALFSVTALAQEQTPASQDAFIQFVNGLLTGLEPGFNGSVAKCIPDADKGYKDVKVFIYLLENGISTQNISEILQSFLYLQDALAAIQKAATDCNYPQIAADIQQLINKLTTNPIAVLDTLLSHLPEVLYYADEAYTDWNSGAFFGSGEAVGDILAFILDSTKQPTEPREKRPLKHMLRDFFRRHHHRRPERRRRAENEDGSRKEDSTTVNQLSTNDASVKQDIPVNKDALDNNNNGNGNEASDSKDADARREARERRHRRRDRHRRPHDRHRSKHDGDDDDSENSKPEKPDSTGN